MPLDASFVGGTISGAVIDGVSRVVKALVGIVVVLSYLGLVVKA
jgi:hypothetical protein